LPQNPVGIGGPSCLGTCGPKGKNAYGWVILHETHAGGNTAGKNKKGEGRGRKEGSPGPCVVTLEVYFKGW